MISKRISRSLNVGDRFYITEWGPNSIIWEVEEVKLHGYVVIVAPTPTQKGRGAHRHFEYNESSHCWTVVHRRTQ